MNARASTLSGFSTFATTVRFEMKQYVRGWSLRALVAFNIINPLFILLSSWIPYRMLGNGGTALFTSVTGINSYLSFVIIGSAFSAFVFTTTYEGARALRYEQWVGTFEALLSTPASRTAWILGKIAAAQIYGSIAFIAVLLMGIGFFGLGASSAPQLPIAVLGLVLTLAAMLGLGFILSGVAVVVRQDNLLALVLWPVFLFLGGFAFPVQSLPSFLQPISWILPITYGLDMTRRAILLGEGFGSFSVSNDLAGLLISTAVLVPIGYLLFDRLMRRGLRKGTLSA